MAIYNHVGQVVADLHRSRRFYEEVLGFRFWYEFKPPDEATARLSSLEAPLATTACYLTLDQFVLELIHYAAPGVTTAWRPRAMNEPGLTHLSVAVDDPRATATKAVEFGAQIIQKQGADQFEDVLLTRVMRPFLAPLLPIHDRLEKGAENRG